MPLAIRVDFPQAEYVKLLRAIDPKTVARAEAQALNRTGFNAAELGIELLAKQLGISRSKLARRGRRLNYRGARQHGRWNIIKRANVRRSRIDLEGAGRRFNVSRFNGKAIRAGSRTSLKTGRTRRSRKGRVLGVTHNAWGKQQTVAPAWQLTNGAFVLPSGNTFRGVYGPGVVRELTRHQGLMQEIEGHSRMRFVHHFSQAIEFWWGRGI